MEVVSLTDVALIRAARVTVNFSGATGGDDGAAYVVKGMLGFYPGYYAIGPYYEKVKEYGDWESRDIWEYRLDLTHAEIDMLLMHQFNKD